MSKRRNRWYEKTCSCGAYRFPHRFGGGVCHGLDIVEDTWEQNWGGGVCADCNSCDKSEYDLYCQVKLGQENVTHCLAWREFVDVNEIRLYKNLKKWFL